MHPHKGFDRLVHDRGRDGPRGLARRRAHARENEAMRITTGSGIRHSESPADDEACNGLQLWVNLPRARRRRIRTTSTRAPRSSPRPNSTARPVTTVVGEGSPIELHTPMEYLDVHVSDTWTWEIPDEWSGFLYGVVGERDRGGRRSRRCRCRHPLRVRRRRRATERGRTRRDGRERRGRWASLRRRLRAAARRTDPPTGAVRPIKITVRRESICDRANHGV